jgi:ketosteroid isomerase-like protein
MTAMDPARSDEDVVRAFFDAYSDQAPDRFAEMVGEDYTDYGHEPPGRGPQGARDDFHVQAEAYGPIDYEIDALVADADGHVAAVWTGHLRDIDEPVRGLSLYRVHDHLLSETRHAIMGPVPEASRKSS